jgi:ABC-2 type transport system permease protein
MKKYLHLYKSFFKANLMKSMAYRKNFILGMFLVAVESLTVIVSVKIVFNHVGNIAGWSFDDMLVLSGIFMITHSLAWLFYEGGVNDLDKIINQGDLDWFLIKPVDTQFLATVHRVDVEDAARSLVGVAIMVIGLQSAPVFQTILMLPVFLLMLLAGQVVLYSITLAIKTISFKSIQGWATNSIFWRFHGLAQYPTDIYHGAVRIIYTFIFPLIFIATVPAKVLTGRFTLSLFFGAIVAAALSFIISRQIWKRALRGYSSASS